MKHPAIHLHESFEQNLQRIHGFYNGMAIKHLHAQTNLNESIHQARLCFKRIRSLLRLARNGLGDKNYSAMNVFYRDQARQLSQARDLTAIIEGIGPLIMNRRSNDTRSLLISVQRQWMLERKMKIHSEELLLAKRNVISRLQHVQMTANPVSTPLSHGGNTEFLEGLTAIYRRGKQLYQTCRSTHDDTDLHEWRKQVKYIWYQLVMLQPLWPGLIRAWSKEWQALSVLLGDHHDLVLIGRALSENLNQPQKHKERANIKKSIGRYKQKLLMQSLILGKKLYAEKDNAVKNKLLACFP